MPPGLPGNCDQEVITTLQVAWDRHVSNAEGGMKAPGGVAGRGGFSTKNSQPEGWTPNGAA